MRIANGHSLVPTQWLSQGRFLARVEPVDRNAEALNGRRCCGDVGGYGLCFAGLQRLFDSEDAAVAVGRAAGLRVVNATPYLKRAVVQVDSA